MKRLPRYVDFKGATAPDFGDRLIFDPAVDLRGGDIVVFPDLTSATVNGVSPHGANGCSVLFGADPSCGPRPHSGKKPPKD